MQVLVSHETVEYYTPSEIVEAARRTMGSIDLDPASCAAANTIVKAETFFSKEDDGLSRDWYGNVWLNPPFSSKGISQAKLWSQKMVDEWFNGNITQGCLLVGSKMGYEWFEKLWNFHPTCFFRKRVHFIREDMTPAPAAIKHGVAVVYFGSDSAAFTTNFIRFGRVV